MFVVSMTESLRFLDAESLEKPTSSVVRRKTWRDGASLLSPADGASCQHGARTSQYQEAKAADVARTLFATLITL